MNAEFLVLAFTAALNPKLLAIDLLLIENRRPRAMFLCILLGGFTVGITIGLLDVLVFHLDAISSQKTASAGVDLALGLLLLAAGALLATGRLHGRRKAPVPAGDAQPGQPEKKDGWAQRALAEPRRLDRETRVTIESGDTEVLFSAASIWEIAIKAGLGRSDFAFDPAEIVQAALDTGFTELAVRSNAAALVGRLPLLHRDPFDRVLVAQAILEPATLYTADQQLVPYSELVRRIEAR